MIRVLAWDDEGVANEILEAWFGEDIELAKPAGRHLVDWGRALRLLVREGPWDMVVTNLYDAELYGHNAGEFLQCWCGTLAENSDLVRELDGLLAGSPFHSLSDFGQGGIPTWFESQRLGAGLLITAQALGVPERLLLSGQILDGGDSSRHLVCELSCSGALTVAMPKEYPEWARHTLAGAIERARQRSTARQGRHRQPS